MAKFNTIPTVRELFKAGAHFGHRKDKCDARAKDYIYLYRNKVAVIDLEKTREKLAVAIKFVSEKAQEGASFLFVGTKMQAREKVRQTAQELRQYYIIERWPGGLLTNYSEVKKSIKKIDTYGELLASEEADQLKKKEKLKIQKDLDKMKKEFGGLVGMNGSPDVIVIIDPKAEEIALKESATLGIPVVALADVNANPSVISYPVIANDDSAKTIGIFLDQIKDAISKNYRPKKVEEPAKGE